MKKQTQSRQYGYVSPKCKFAQVPTGMAFCASPQYNDQGLQNIISGDGGGVEDHTGDWGLGL